MFRIGIIGTENSHATDLARRINLSEDYPDCRVTLVWGHYPEENERIARDFGCSVASGTEEMVENTDAVLVTARDGKFHAEFARPFIEAGKPAFIDKPFTVDVNEASELIELAKKKGVPLCGGSTLKYADAVEALKACAASSPENILGGSVYAPVVMDSEYSGFFFYSPHLAEMTLEIFGYAPKAVTAVKNAGGVCAMVDYGDFCVANHFGSGASDYCASVYSKSGSEAKKIDLSMIGAKNCAAFVKMLRTGQMPRSYEELLAPVRYLNAVKKAYETGERVEF
ncbi:MAG: Gfo/Idh/MocA family oxidoreductase [Oscillospiraceae bacterium]|nr:Gfo/Idh/MocA family oxidoreductase [Oscillospiraceae bacterium]